MKEKKLFSGLIGKKQRIIQYYPFSFFKLAVFTALFSIALLSNAQNSDKYILIPGGTFPMGSPPTEAGRSSHELQRQVTVNSFYMSKFEVTQGEYQELMGTNPSNFNGDTLPVEQVTWFNAIEYCNRLSEKEGLTSVYTIDGQNVTWNRTANGYRLPTEAEWEYACRAGTTTPFYTGENITSEQANFDGGRPYNNGERSEYMRMTLPVGSFAPNAFGLYDMYGNVGEWCWDLNGEYSATDVNNPTGVTSGGYRIFRGGGWNHSGDFLRSARRGALLPANKGHYLGFRVARNAQ